jgi:hypothetical protein
MNPSASISKLVLYPSVLCVFIFKELSSYTISLPQAYTSSPIVNGLLKNLTDAPKVG